MKNKFTFLFVCLLLLKVQAIASIVYVDNTHVGGTQNGSSWATAFSDLQAGIDSAGDGDSIWVAKGTYQPLTPFIMKQNVKILGGFLNTDNNFNQRSFEDNLTVLVGYYNRTIINDGNQLDTNAVLDGFTVKNGGIDNEYSSPMIRNCVFDSNKASNGGAMYNYSASPVIQNCTFINNIADFGAAIYGYESSIVLLNSIFTANQANDEGGAIYSNTNCVQQIVNCSFEKNTTYSYLGAGQFGGAVSNGQNCHTTFINCLLTGNSSANGGAIYNNPNGALDVVNCTIANNIALLAGGIYNGNVLNIYNTIISGNSSGGVYNNDWGTSTVMYSLIQGMYADTENYNLDGSIDPKFNDPTNNDFHLKAQSPCIDKGDDSSYMNEGGNLQTDLDLGNQSRLLGSSIDMGAYEGTGATTNVISPYNVASQWSVYPNPTMENIYINSSDAKLLHTSSIISDLSGRIIKTFVIENKLQSISLSDIPAGIYLLKMQNGETAKIVKQ